MANWSDVKCRDCGTWFPLPAHADGMPTVAADQRICASCNKPNRRSRLRSRLCCKLMIWAVKVDDEEAYKLAYGLGQSWNPEHKLHAKPHPGATPQAN